MVACLALAAPATTDADARYDVVRGPTLLLLLPFLGVMVRVFSRAIRLRMDRSSFWAFVSSCSRFSSLPPPLALVLLLLPLGRGREAMLENNKNH